MQNIVILLTIFFVGYVAANEGQWSYMNRHTNPSQWPRMIQAMCSGWAQSPIALNSETSTYLGEESDAVVAIAEHSSRNRMPFTATNNGHALSVSIPDRTWTITLNDKAKHYFEVRSFHFHWGGANDRGSEHHMDGKAFPLEMHIVGQSSMYPEMRTAITAPGGLVVIGVFFQLTTDHSKSSLSKMGDLLSKIDQLTYAGSTVNVQYFDPQVMLPENRDRFFRYQGSLTTPPCTENVQWTMMREPLYVTNSDLELLRSLRYGDSNGQKPMRDNFRPIQPLNAVRAPQPRVLYKSWSAASRPIAALFLAINLCWTHLALYG